MNKSIKRGISTILAITLAVCTPMISVYANAESVDELAGLTVVDTSSETISGVLSENDIPECLALEVSENSKFAARLYEKETSLDTVLFANKDGSETVYIFNEDVKYRDESGNIADKSNKLYSNIESRAYSTDYSYVNKENDINTYFPKSLKTDVGVSVEAQGQVIEMYPVSDVVSQVIADTDLHGVYYDDVFGEFTGIRYKPSFSGYKEDIILEKNVGNKFSFILETDDLVPVLENGVIYIRDESGENFGVISPTYVYDSFAGDPSLDENRHFTYDNKFELTNVSYGKYELVVMVDEEFLDNPATVYPVIVDPSIAITAASGSSKSILDTPIYNGGISGTAGLNQLAVVGYVDSSYGSGRLLMRFPGLMNQSFMSEDYIIDSATLTLSECSGGSASSTIYAYNYTGPAWDETTTYSSSVYNGVGSSIDYWSFSYPNYTTRSYDITSAVKSWQLNSSKGNKGIIFKNNTSESDYSKTKTFYTTEGATKPYLTITYVGDNVDFDNAHTISMNEVTVIDINTSNQKRYFKFVAPSTGYYSFESLNNKNADPYGWLYNSGINQLDFSDDHGGDKNFHMIQRLTGGQLYYFTVGCYGSGTGRYSIKVVPRTAPAENAYTDKGGLGNRTVTIQLASSTASGSTWKPLIETARDGWNKSKAGTNISLTPSSSPFRLYVDTYPWSELGKTEKYPQGNYTATSGNIRINSRLLSGESDNYKISVIAHEMGHLFWLGDNPYTAETSLMSHNRDRETVIRPQFIDVYHVVNKYS